MPLRHAWVAVLCLALLAPAAARAVTVHGLVDTPLGAATLSVTGNAATGYALEIDNLGSSGQDGVSIQLPRSNGIELAYGTPQLPSANIVHRDLACRTMVGGAPVTLARLVEDLGPAGILVSLDVPGSPPVTIEAWNGSELVYSSVQPHGTPIGLPGISIDEPGVHVAMTFESEVENGVTVRTVSATVTRPTTIITIRGENFGANRYVLRAGVPLSPTLECTDAQITCASDGSGGGGGGAAGRMAITTKGVPAKKVKSKARPAHLSALSGVVLEADTSTPDTRLHVSRAPGDPDPGVFRLNGLPPGEPVLGSLAVALSPDWLDGAPGQSMSIQARVVQDAADGSPPAEITDLATWTTTAGGGFRLDGTRSTDDGVIRTYLYRGPRQTVDLDQGSPRPVASRTFTRHQIRCADGRSSMGFGFPPGVVITVGGVVQDADSVVVEFSSPSSNSVWFRDEHWNVSDASSLTVESAECIGALGENPYGLAQVALGNASIVPDYAARRREIRNLGSSGEDGVAIECAGAAGVDVPFDPPVSLETFASLRWKTQDCDDDDGCPHPSSELRCYGAGQPRPQSCDAVFPSAGSNPVFVETSDGRRWSYLDMDDDGDGLIELAAAPGSSEVSIARVAYKKRKYAEENFAEAFWLEFGEPVAITVSGQPEIVHNLRFRWNTAQDLPSSGSPPGLKLFSVTGQPTPVGESSTGQFTISEPGIESAVDAIGDPGVHSSFAGFPALETWTQVSGEVRCADLDRDGRLDLARSSVFTVGNDKPTLGATMRERPRVFAPVPLLKVTGYGFRASYDSIGPWPDSMSVSLNVTGLSGGAAYPASLTVAADASGVVPVRYTLFDSTGDPADVTVRAYHGGVLQGSAPYPTDGVGGSHPPGVILIEADLDGDGGFESLCTAFPPGATVTLGGPPLPCDSLVFKIGGAISVEDIVNASVSLNGLPPGEPILDTRFAALGRRGTLTSAPEPGALPLRFALSPAWPNPSTGASAIRFSLPAASRVRATVIDVSGRAIAKLADRPFDAGEHVLRWDGRRNGGAPAPAGLYFVRVERQGERDARVVRLTRLR